MTLLRRFVAHPLARAAIALLGLGLVILLLRHVDRAALRIALQRSLRWFPLVVLLEGGMLFCDMASLRLLYGDDRRRVPIAALVRAALAGYPVMCLVPMGRAFAEAARAAWLARHASAARATAAAARLQGLLLISNAIISVPCILAGLALLGVSLFPAAMTANLLVTLALGAVVLFGGRRSHIGAALARRSKRAEHFGPALDGYLHDEPALPLAPLLWTIATRVVQTLQYAVLVVAVGGSFGLSGGLLAEGVHLVGAAVGDLIPGQVGATEGNFTLFAKALSLAPADAVTIALVAHFAQVFWTIVGLFVPLVWPLPPVAVASAPSTPETVSR